MKLIALQDFTPDGFKKYRKGDRFEMPAAESRTLIMAQLASVDTEEPKNKRDYKRRDMQAER